VTVSALRAASSIALLTAGIGALLISLQYGEGASDPGGPARRRRHPIDPPFLIFRTLSPPEGHGNVALLRLGAASGERQLTNLSCLRLHYASGRGLCVVQESVKNDSVYAAYVFDRALTRGRRIPLGGVPTRVRVAPNGRRGAITTYFEEESPAGERLAIDSIIVDMAAGRVIADLREFRIESDGLPAPTPPIDVGNVSFERDGDRFFASIATPRERYLAAGSIRERRMTTIRTGVASESLSPDGRRLLVKKQSAPGVWQLAVIDLRDWSERNLQHGQRSIDDQVEWLDNEHVVYHDTDDSGTSLWLLAVDGVSGPRVFVKDAYSGAVQR
jgi:hypothetical protein